MWTQLPEQSCADWGTKWQEVQCRVLQGARGVLRTSEAEALNTARRRQRGGPAPKWCFIFSASTLSCLHPSSGSRLRGLPLIPLDRPLSPLIPPWAPVCARSPSRVPFFPSLSLLSFFFFFCCVWSVPVFCSCWCIQWKLITPFFSACFCHVRAQSLSQLQICN